jgi:hypothetical protein
MKRQRCWMKRSALGHTYDERTMEEICSRIRSRQSSARFADLAPKKLSHALPMLTLPCSEKT